MGQLLTNQLPGAKVLPWTCLCKFKGFKVVTDILMLPIKIKSQKNNCSISFTCLLPSHHLWNCLEHGQIVISKAFINYYDFFTCNFLILEGQFTSAFPPPESTNAVRVNFQDSVTPPRGYSSC